VDVTGLQSVASIARLDTRTSLSSGMTLLVLFVPILATVAVRVGLPFLLAWISRFYTVNEPLVLAVAGTLVLTTGPMMVGLVFGFVMLDERDVHLVDYYSVTPLDPARLLAVRIAAPVAIQLAYGAILLPILGIARGSGPLFGALLVTAVALEAPLFAIVIALCAENRLEGMTIAKAISLTSFLSVIGLLLPTPQAYAVLAVPQSWLLAAVLAEQSLTPSQFVAVDSAETLLVVAILYHAALCVGAARAGLRALYRA
jgi:hypothetical protein